MPMTIPEIITLVCTVISAICAIISIKNAKATSEIKNVIENNPKVNQILSKGSTVSIITGNSKQ